MDGDPLFQNIDPRVGAFEVSLNGILLYSKLKSKLWPNVARVANRCAKICDE